MLSTLRHSTRAALTTCTSQPSIRTAATASQQKRAGDISDAFVSLSGQDFKPLPPRYADLKASLIRGNEDAVRASWERLLKELRHDISEIIETGSAIVPEVNFSDIRSNNVSDAFKQAHRKRGVAVVRGVVPEQQALEWKQQLREYIHANPHTKAFPADKPQVFELYWSPTQMRARTNPNLLAAQKFLMSFWHSKDPSAPISTQHPTSYADRLRMRLPGDAKFALGPHVDGGSVERWEPDGYGRGKVYDSIWAGRWEDFDPWEASCRLPVVSDMYQGVGACSMFRMYQGWLALSNTGPFEGTLLVNPLLAKATAYFLLRPFFAAKRGPEAFGGASDAFLSPDNWALEPQPSSSIQGATPGHGQELSALLHPHLDLERSMVHVPRVQPGDYVAWHCDTIHAVDKTHGGTTDSSVLYIPTCPLTEPNAAFVARQRAAFLEGIPCPDFGGGEGEKRHVGRPGVKEVAEYADEEGMRALGLAEWDSAEEGLTQGQREVMDRANKVLGFYA
ncbi:hypothetical protein H2199_001128 [Coniosporium tulheliwenetii]|uniref:Uncharacterized protein n=1 Tax=Coniosporium tulheliwenetii TaxID=3383036 RepID=A0ACC2ZL19_9PEZI|nr:hypothetical protein H2199_001128 [Cladosporium sp. JES 115]